MTGGSPWYRSQSYDGYLITAAHILTAWTLLHIRSRHDDASEIKFDWTSCENDMQESSSSSPNTCSVNAQQTDVDLSISTILAIVEATSQDVLHGSDRLSLRTGKQRTSEDFMVFNVRFTDYTVSISRKVGSKGPVDYIEESWIECFFPVLAVVLERPTSTIKQILEPLNWDLDKLWSWNGTVPPTIHKCIQDSIADCARQQPNKQAICAWDGELAYGEVDRYSTIVAQRLRSSGASEHKFVALCFEKSRWTIVAALAVLKAGAAFVMLDPALPVARLQNIMEQTGSRMILTSPIQFDNASRVAQGVPRDVDSMIIECATFRNASSSDHALPTVSPAALMYAIFTSGSTGTPKGVLISHETYTSSAYPRATAVGYHGSSRVLDFAAYAFDVSIDSMFLTLLMGGCLCIPSDEDRMNNINRVMIDMQINYAGLTPTVARVLDESVIMSLDALGLGGEAVSAQDARRWGKLTRIVIGYGPCECTIGCTINSSAATEKAYITIGPGNGAVIWVVDPEDHNKLMRPGAVGELLVEGPIVGQGYLNDPDKTEQAFIRDPTWLVGGYKAHAGRQGRLYKTGDIGKYDPDGSGEIIFVGRKDASQVKLRGQRVELGEIESCLRDLIPKGIEVVVDVISPADSISQSVLVAFLAETSRPMPTADKSLSRMKDSALGTNLDTIHVEMEKTLPRYMLPNAYVPVNYIPKLISGKIDRKTLKAFGCTIKLHEVSHDVIPESSQPWSALELKLRSAWSVVLGVKEASLQRSRNFFAAGGNSILAMRLVSLCRSESIVVTVADIFNNPTIGEMAKACLIDEEGAYKVEQPATLLSPEDDGVLMAASDACGVATNHILDIYACTPTQESLFTFSLKSEKPYIAQRVARLSPDIRLEALKDAWTQVVAWAPILSTRVITLETPGLFQVVVAGDIKWRHSTNLAQYLMEDSSEPMDLGRALARYAVVEDRASNERYLVWTIHHVLYDGWSEPMLLRAVQDVLDGKTLPKSPKMVDFVQHLHNLDQEKTKAFWRDNLRGANGPQFPQLPSRDFVACANLLRSRDVRLVLPTDLTITLATLLRGSLALVLSKHIDSTDIIFGETLIGRDISLPNADQLIGPMIATVPVRIQTTGHASVRSYLLAVQSGMAARSVYQHMGMQHIRRVSSDAQVACETGTGIVIQPKPTHGASLLGFENKDPALEALHFNPYPVMFAFAVDDAGFTARVSFDDTVVSETLVESILGQLEATCHQILQDLEAEVDTISCMSETELNDIWTMNAIAPMRYDAEFGGLRASPAIVQGTQIPPVAVPWVCAERSPHTLVPFGCAGELWLEGSYLPGECLENPRWLVAGSANVGGRNGKIHSTGDVVILGRDGNLSFVRRREDVIFSRGLALDLAKIERDLQDYVSHADVLATLLPDNDGSDNQQTMLFLINHPVEKRESSDFPPKDLDIVEATAIDQKLIIQSDVSKDLASLLKRHSRHAKESMPGHIHIEYILTDLASLRSQDMSRQAIVKMALQIPKAVLDEARDKLHHSWASEAKSSRNQEETVLISVWAELLGIDCEKIDVSDNFFRLGGDSVLAMKLVSRLRSKGYALTVAEIFKHMRLDDSASVMRPIADLKTTHETYQPFSLLPRDYNPQQYKQKFSTGSEEEANTIEDAYPATSMQILDVVATLKKPRTSLQYTTLTFDSSVDPTRLQSAWRSLVSAHEILRTIFVEDTIGLVQVVLSSSDIPVEEICITEIVADEVNKICAQDAERDFDATHPLCRILHIIGESGNHVFVIAISHALYDGVSLPRILMDLETFYQGGVVSSKGKFSQYMAASLSAKHSDPAIAYWSRLLEGSSLTTVFPISCNTLDESLFLHESLTTDLRLGGFTAATVSSAAWAVALMRIHSTSDVTFLYVSSGRGSSEFDCEDTIGPCYQLVPIRTAAKDSWTCKDLLDLVQQQTRESSAFDFLGHRRIQDQCSTWQAESFDRASVVHYQHEMENQGTSLFAGHPCVMDAEKPHGDQAMPLKVVIYTEHGKQHAGVVGPKSEQLKLREMLSVFIECIAYVTAEEGSQRVFR